MLVLDGSNDLVIPTINGFTLQQHLPNAQLIIYPDSSHAPFYQYPALFLEHARLFLRRLSRAPATSPSGRQHPSLFGANVMPTLENKVALVTGASRGIGAAIAKRLAADGARVAITYAKDANAAAEVVKSIEQAGGSAIAIQADAADPAAVRSAVEQAVAAFGGLDVLVNNAGTAIPKPFEEATLEEMNRVIDINLRGVLITTQAALKHLNDGGRIINIGSCVGERMGTPGLATYAATKGAVKMFTQGLSREVGSRGITVNNVQPGPIDTDLNPADDRWAAPQIANTALKRYGHVDDIASWWRSSPVRRPATSPARASPSMAEPTPEEHCCVHIQRESRACHRRLARHRTRRRHRSCQSRRAGSRPLRRNADEARAVVDQITAAGGRAEAIGADLAMPEGPTQARRQGARDRRRAARHPGRQRRHFEGRDHRGDDASRISTRSSPSMSARPTSWSSNCCRS